MLYEVRFTVSKYRTLVLYARYFWPQAAYPPQHISSLILSPFSFPFRRLRVIRRLVPMFHCLRNCLGREESVGPPAFCFSIS